MTTTLRDSGLSNDQMLVFLSEAFGTVRGGTNEWTPELNDRRIELLDKDIASVISFDEKVELAMLTDALPKVLMQAGTPKAFETNCLQAID